MKTKMTVTKSFMYFALLLCYAAALKVRYPPCTPSTPPSTFNFDKKLSLFFHNKGTIINHTVWRPDLFERITGYDFFGLKYTKYKDFGYCASQQQSGLVSFNGGYSSYFKDIWMTTANPKPWAGNTKYTNMSHICWVYPKDTPLQLIKSSYINFSMKIRTQSKITCCYLNPFY